jgi:long-subunit acyl-CoA synthetase (AMP-forming)
VSVSDPKDSSQGEIADRRLTVPAIGTCTKGIKGEMALGAVGPPTPVGEIKLVDVPDMGYTSNDKPWPRGELCVRGQHVTPGYYKDEEKTKDLIDEEGWMHSGDIAASE